MNPEGYATLALQHFSFAGQLSLQFALVTLAYLGAAWRIAGRMSPSMAFVLHTLFLGWQSNVAYLAVVTLLAAQSCLARAPEPAVAGWNAAPWFVPGAAVLYASVLALSVLFYFQCARRNRP